MSKILAFDQSSQTTGFAYFEDNKFKECGKFTLDSKNIGDRLVDFRRKVLELISHYSPDEVIFEDIQEQNSIPTFKILAQVQGVMIELLTYLQIPYTIMPSVTWKSALSIKGRARAEQKRNAQQYIMKTYDLKVTQDEADSICIGDAYLKQQKCAW